ncbi:MAG: hypothetical protein E6I90_13275 [Chloroflexi bacterium]|nr:MAG: hypothetical protein E6I90_13275 [Chloroflexota bacterium]
METQSHPVDEKGSVTCTARSMRPGVLGNWRHERSLAHIIPAAPYGLKASSQSIEICAACSH